jgi:hypothetical protein
MPNLRTEFPTVPDKQLRIDRWPSHLAVEWRQFLPQAIKLDEPVDRAQQVIGRNPIFEAKRMKKRRLTVALLPHHAAPPIRPNHRRQPPSTDFFNKIGASSSSGRVSANDRSVHP